MQEAKQTRTSCDDALTEEALRGLAFAVTGNPRLKAGASAEAHASDAVNEILAFYHEKPLDLPKGRDPLAALREELRGEIIEVCCYRANISPCVDCRRCAKEPGCAIRDGMQDIYPVLEECDNIVIASPVYFSLPTGPLLNMCSRIQTYFCATFFRRSPVPIKPKRGGVILSGGGSGSAAPAEETARRILKYMKAKEIGPVAASLKTDKGPAADDSEALEAARALARFLNREDH